MEILSCIAIQALEGGGGGGGAILVGYITKGSAFPTQRPDGSPLKVEDYVKVAPDTPAGDFPFTISGITFETRKDKAIYLGSNRWMLDAGAVQFTNETPTANKTAESLNENGTTQAQVNLQVANIIGRKKTLSVSDKTNLIDALNFAWQELKKAGYDFELSNSDTDNIREIVLTVRDYDNNEIYSKTLGNFVLEGRKIAGCDLADDITPQEIQNAIKNLTATLTNKTIDADDNDILNLETDNFKTGVIKTQADTTTGGSNTTLLTEKATIDLHNTAGHSLNLSLTGKVLQIQLKDKLNNVLDTQNVDIEYVKNISWDNTTPKLVLTKSDNTTIDVELTKAVITDKTQTLTNKILDIDNNTMSNVEVDNFKSTALAQSTDDVRNYTSSTDTKLTTEKFLQKALQNIFTPQNNTDAVNKEYVDTLLEELTGKVMKFKGFIGTTAPTGTTAEGSLWYESATLPTTFPINVKTYTNGQWSTTTTEYTPSTMDLWSNLNDSKGYYWFGNEWNLIDEAVRTDDITITKNQNGELTFKTKTSADKGKAWVVDTNGNFVLKYVLTETDNTTIQLNANEQIEVKDSGITRAKLNTNVADGTTIELDGINGLQVKDNGITKEKINNNVIDNSTIGKTTTGELEVKDTGITNGKLATDIKVGSLALLTTTEKANVVGAINELDDKKLNKLTSTGTSVYSHTSTTQGEMAVKTSMSTTAQDTNLLTEKGTKDYVDSKVRYVHTVVRYNNDNFDYPMGWFKVINNKATMTIDDFKQWFTDNNYNSAAKSWYWCGGCCGTTSVRNSADTGTAYVGKVVSGVYYVPAEDSFYFKGDYNATVTILYSRIKIISEQI